MDGAPPPIDPSGGAYEEIPARTGAGGWLFALLHLALGGVTVALAVDTGFARDKAAFSSDAWRAVFGLVGAALAFLALRAIVRMLGDARRRLTPELHRRAALRGRVLILVGIGFFVVATVEGIGNDTVALAGWAKPFYICGAVYLVLMGLVFQWNPTRFMRQQRLARGEGTPGTARILRANDTGTSVNDAPQVKIDFELEVGGRVHLVSDKIVMERAKLALLIPGSTVDVLVDRADPNVFHVDWDSWRAPVGSASGPGSDAPAS